MVFGVKSVGRLFKVNIFLKVIDFFKVVWYI